ncbi:MAG: hypothetical protein ACLFUX_04180, partial [Spirochaetaceae bacterium]
MSDEQKASGHADSKDHASTEIPESEEFDRYGVWVKAGPEDVEEGEQAEDGDVRFGLDDLSEEELSTSEESTRLTEEEEDALADLESELEGLEDTGDTEFDLEDFESLEEMEEASDQVPQHPSAGETAPAEHGYREEEQVGPQASKQGEPQEQEEELEELSLELDGEELDLDLPPEDESTQETTDREAAEESYAGSAAADEELGGLEESSSDSDVFDLDIDLDED